MKRPKTSTSSYYKERYHNVMNRIIKEKERRIMRQHKIEPKRDMGEDDAGFIPKDKNDN
jgi:hypothetical protein